jgi:hypothetical protein
MSENVEGRKGSSQQRSSALSYFSHRWEELFFFFTFALLCFENLAFVANTEFLSSLRGAMSLFASFELFVVGHLSYLTLPLIIAPLAYLLPLEEDPSGQGGI